MTLKEMLESRAKCVADARQILNQAQDEGREPTAEERQKFDAFMNEADDLQAKIKNAQADAVRRQKIQEVEDEMSKPMPRIVTPQSGGKENVHREYKFKDGRTLTLDQFGSRGTPDYEQDSAITFVLVAQGCTASGQRRRRGYTVPATFNAQLIRSWMTWSLSASELQAYVGDGAKVSALLVGH